MLLYYFKYTQSGRTSQLRVFGRLFGEPTTWGSARTHKVKKSDDKPRHLIFCITFVAKIYIP